MVQLYSVRHSGDMARIRDTAPVICRGYVIFEVRHAKRSQRRGGDHRDDVWIEGFIRDVYVFRLPQWGYSPPAPERDKVVLISILILSPRRVALRAVMRSKNPAPWPVRAHILL